jgi:hypothetical protein
MPPLFRSFNESNTYTFGKQKHFCFGAGPSIIGSHKVTHTIVDLEGKGVWGGSPPFKNSGKGVVAGRAAALPTKQILCHV